MNENSEYNFVDSESEKIITRRFLYVYLGKKIKFQGMYNTFLIPLFNELKLRYI